MIIHEGGLMESPDNLKYTKDHEWIKLEDGIATIGITNYAQEQLGDIVYVELPDEGDFFNKDETFGTVESVKSVSDCYAPVSGRVVETNDLLSDNPETINQDCYGEGWMVRLELEDESVLNDLMSSEEYEKYIKEESE